MPIEKNSVVNEKALTSSNAFREALKLFKGNEDPIMPAVVQPKQSSNTKPAARKIETRSKADYYSGLPSESTKALMVDIDLDEDSENSADLVIKRVARRKRKFAALEDFPITPSPETIKRVQSGGSSSSTEDSETESITSEMFKNNMKKTKEHVDKLGRTRGARKKRAAPVAITYCACRTSYLHRETYEPGETFVGKQANRLTDEQVLSPIAEEGVVKGSKAKKPFKHAKLMDSAVPD